jgi:hypothetical protein
MSRGTCLSPDTILGMLTITEISVEEGEVWFG